MNSQSLWFPRRWPAEYPDRIQLYSMATPNGQKVSIALEELGLPYEAHLVHIGNDDQFDDDYLKLSPNGKIPTLSDPDGPDGKQIALMESGAILQYLAEKTGQLMPTDAHGRYQTMQWLFFQMGHVGPMFGQFGHFNNYATDQCDHPYPRKRYFNETRRLLGVIDEQLKDRPFLVGKEYTIADIAIWPWVDALGRFYEADVEMGVRDFNQLYRWLETIRERPAVQIGKDVCHFDQQQTTEKLRQSFAQGNTR